MDNETKLVLLQTLSDLRVVLPATAEFLRADLSGDPSAELDTVEHAKGAAK